MKDYASMSDFEINCRVHAEVMEISGLDSFKAKDYCHNPADAWSIITASMISIRPIGSGGQLWEASGMGGMKADYDKNPLRAAMVVFLIMKDGE